VDDILRQAVQGISDLITFPGIINVDFADVRAIMQDAGSALMGIGTASGEDRAAKAALSAIQSPLLEISIEGARGVLFNVSGNEDLTMAEVAQAAKQITDSIDPDAKVIFGVTYDESIKKGDIKITVIATGFDYQGQPSQSKAPKVKQVQEIYKSPEKVKIPPRQILDRTTFSPKKETPKIHLDSQENITQIDFDQKLNIDITEDKNQQGDDFDIPAFIRKKIK
jgi:cell division protein FtsZ